MLGFRQVKISKPISDIGKGLNEGYTQLITMRYFFDYDNDETYNILVYFAKMIENIIGKDIMEELYFNADLYNLKEIIKEDTLESEFMQFLKDSDWLINCGKNPNKKEFTLCIQRMGNFVYLTYLKKQKRLFYEGKISYNEYYFRVNKTLSEINDVSFKWEETMISNCNKEKMLEDLRKFGINIVFFSGKFYLEEENEKEEEEDEKFYMTESLEKYSINKGKQY